MADRDLKTAQKRLVLLQRLLPTQPTGANLNHRSWMRDQGFCKTPRAPHIRHRLSGPFGDGLERDAAARAKSRQRLAEVSDRGKSQHFDSRERTGILMGLSRHLAQKLNQGTLASSPPPDLQPSAKINGLASSHQS